MPSILPDFEYDIFISYRQNDNKRDGWVSNFVQALQDELEATLKNPVSIYFDENPHDGLLETHQVNATLDNKLKCIVFMPIISQTYCHQEGYAWSQEFMPFLEMANSDSLGMNIRLANGNVVSRVLPIRIHDLDSEDLQLLEQKLEGPVRAIDFIYKEPGVNRPLTTEDSKADNLNNTSYRNQVNKVANALKEIGVAVLRSDKSDQPIESSSLEPIKSTTDHRSLRWPKIGLAVLVAVLLMFLAYRFIPEKFAIEKEKSIAVLPFTKVNTGEQIEALAFGIHDDLLTKLSKVNELQVTSRTSVMEYEDTRKKISEIADELAVSYVLEGSIQQSSNRFRLNIQLIDGETDDHLWADIFDLELTTDNIFQVQSEIAANIAGQMETSLSPELVNSIDAPPTESLAALRLYNQGKLLMQSQPPESISRLQEALTIDPDFHKCRAELVRATSLYYKSIPDSSHHKENALAELNYLKQNSEDSHLRLMGQAYYDYYALGDFKLARKNLLSGDQDNSDVIEAQCFIARRLDDWDTYFDFADNIILKRDPRNPSALQDLSLSLIMNKKFSRGLEYIDRAIDYSEQSIYKDLKFNILVSNFGDVARAEVYLNEEKPGLNLNQVAMWQYWVDYYKRDFKALINPTIEVPHGMILSNGDYSNLVQLPSELFVAQAYWLMGEAQGARDQVTLYGKHWLDHHAYENCHVAPGGDFYGTDATKHISRGYALLFNGNSEDAQREAEHAMKLYPVSKDGIQGRVVQDLAFRLIAMTGDGERTVDLADELLGSISWTSLEMIKSDPIYDQYREDENFKMMISKYEIH